MFLNKINFIKDFRCYKKNETIEFKDNLTFISGDNGSGKSSLLSCIRNMYETKWSLSDDSASAGVIEIDGDEDVKKVKLIYLDLSSDLYKNAHEFDYDNMDVYMQCRHSSSGEGVIFQLVDLLKKNVGSANIIILDEPERGLSVKNQILISKVIQKFHSENPSLQFIVTTHSEAVFMSKEELWSATHKRYVSIDEYTKWLYS